MEREFNAVISNPLAPGLSEHGLEPIVPVPLAPTNPDSLGLRPYEYAFLTPRTIRKNPKCELALIDCQGQLTLATWLITRTKGG
jgi:hypothetical protein